MNWKSFFSSLTIAANCLLCFFLLFYERLVVPQWLQVFGRIHPLFLHFPIVLFALLLIWTWAIPKRRWHDAGLAEQIGEWLSLSAALTAVLTALMGILLSKEPGYNPESLAVHKYSGVALSIILLFWYLFHRRVNSSGITRTVVGLSSLVILLIAGHEGAVITHGDDFLIGPLYKGRQKVKVSLNEAIVYRDMVEPILEAKCMSCHNSTKAKGGLVMTTPQSFLKGGKNGPALDTSSANMSLLLQRIHLPEDDKKHMPPAGRSSLSDLEMAILYNWIKDGASFTIKLNALDPTDTLRTIAGNLFRTPNDPEVYNFSAAGEDKIRKLNTSYRVVYPLATGSPAVVADFFGAAFFKSDQLKELSAVKTQLVSLNLSRMPVTDNDLSVIGEFSNLRELDLSFTKITGSGLDKLEKLQHLQRLSLTNTAVRRDEVEKLLTLKELHQLNVWNTGLSYTDAGDIKKKYLMLDIEAGSRADTLSLKINPPTDLTAGQIIHDTPVELKLKHFIPGTTIRYTLDGSDPDSMTSIVYTGRPTIDSAILMKARAFRKGWRPSEIVQSRFYRATFVPDTIILLTATDTLFKGRGGMTLKDLQKGSQNFGDGKWIAWRDRRMEALLVFHKQIHVHSVMVSSLVNAGAMIVQPRAIRIMGGNQPGSLHILYQSSPAMDTLLTANYLIPYECKFTPVNVRYIKVMVEPAGKLPPSLLPPPPPPPPPAQKQPPNTPAQKPPPNTAAQKPSPNTPAQKPSPKTQAIKKEKPKPANDKGWFFVDELFVN